MGSPLRSSPTTTPSLESRNSSASLTVCLATSGPSLLFTAINSLGQKCIKLLLNYIQAVISGADLIPTKNGTSYPLCLSIEGIFIGNCSRNEGTKVQRGDKPINNLAHDMQYHTWRMKILQLSQINLVSVSTEATKKESKLTPNNHWHLLKLLCWSGSALL